MSSWSANIASSIETSPLLKTTHGTPDPKLTRPAQDISLLDIYLAVEQDKPLFYVDHKTNPQCIVGGNIQSTLEQFYAAAEISAKAKLNQITLADVIDTILVKQKQKEHQKRS